MFPNGSASFIQSGNVLCIQILFISIDTAGQVEFTAMRDQYMRCGEGFIICYSVTDRHSFQEASEYRKLITRVRLTEDIPLVLIANKSDLQSQRKVSISPMDH